MNININLKPSRKLKKLLLLLLFALLCFFIKNKVFALNVPDYLENFSDYTINCDTSNTSACPDDNPHTFKAMTEYFTGIMHRYSLVAYDDFYADYDYRFYFFSVVPYAEKIEHYQEGVHLYDFYNLYDTPTKTINSTFIFIRCNSKVKTCDVPRFSYSIFNTVIENKYNAGIYDDNFEHLVHSNFNFQDINEKILFEQTSNKLVDWTDSEDLENDNRNWFEKLIDNIIAIPQRFASYIKDLFIPKEEQFTEFLNDEFDFMKKKLGFFWYPIELITDFVNRVKEIAESKNANFHIPKVTFMGTEIIKEINFDLYSIIETDEQFKKIYNIYNIFVSGLIIIWLSNLAIKEYNKTIGGA